MPDSELERVFVTFLAEDRDLEKTYQKIIRRAKEVSGEVSKAFDQSVAKGFEGAGERVTRSAQRQAEAVDEVEEAFKALRNETAALRHTVEAGATSQEDAIKRFKDLQAAALQQSLGFAETSDEYRKFTQVAAQASRSVATLEGRATKLGFSANAAVGITAAFNQNLSRMGTAGDVAGEALGIISREFRLLMQLDPATFTRNLASSITVLSIAGAGLAAAAIGGLTAALFKMGKTASEAADAIDKGSQSAGLSAEAYQELRYAFEQNGVEVGQFDMAMQALNRRLGLAAQGNQTYAKAYEQLGISIRDANGNLRGTEDLVMEVVEALSQLPNAAEQAALASTIFNDDVAKKLIPTIRAGGDALQELRDQARDLGLILSGDAIISLVEFKDRVAEIQRQFETARLEIVGAFIPIFNDLLLPLLQNTVVPALQGVAQRVRDLSQAFLDAGPAGAEFRAQMLANIQPLLSFGDVVIGIGQGFLSFVQLVLGGAAGIGASLGELSVQLERFVSGMADITEGLAWWQQGNLLGALEIFKRARNLGSEVFDPSAITDAFNRAADSYLDRSYDLAVEAQERLARGLSGDYSEAFNRLTESIQGAISAGASSFAPALTDAVNEAVNGGALSGLEKLPEGSLAALQQEVQAAQRDFNLVITEEDRKAAKERERIAQEAINAIMAAYQNPDILAAAKAWTGRLTAELQQGVKDNATVADLITAGIENVREEAAKAFDEFGWDSQQYRDAITKLEFLEAFLKRIVGIDATVAVNIDTSQARAALETAFAVLETRFGDGILATVQAVQQSEGVFTSFSDALTKLSGVGIVITGPMLEYLTDRFGDTEGAAKNAAAAINEFAVAEQARLAAIQTQRFSGDAGLLFTLQALERTTGPIDSVNSALQAFAREGIVLTAEMLTFLVERFEGTADAAEALDKALETLNQSELARYRDAQTRRFSGDAPSLFTIQAVEQTQGVFESVSDAFTKFAEAGQVVTAPILRLLTERFEGAGDSAADLGATIREKLVADLTAAGLAAQIFGTENELAAKQLALLETAIMTLLQADPNAVISDLQMMWESIKAGADSATDSLDDASGGMDNMKSTAENLVAAMAQLKELTGDAPSQWDTMADAFKAAEKQGLITTEELNRLVEILAKLKGEAEGLSKLRDLAADINFGTDIAEGLTNALGSLTTGDFTGALGNLSSVGAAIGSLLGNSAAGALAGAIGSAIAALPALFQAISDLFTGDSPARRELAESLTVTVAGAFRTGIFEGLRGAEGWQDTLRENVKESVFGALVDAFIEASVVQAIFAPFIDEFTKILHSQGVDAAFAFFDSEFDSVFDKGLTVIEGFVSRADRLFEDAERVNRVDPTAGVFELPTATVSVLAAPQWALELTASAERIGAAGDRMLEAAELMKSTFDSGLNVNTTSTRGIDAQRAV